MDGLTDGEVYEVLGVDPLTGAFRLIDDSGEDYLYSPTEPGPIGDPGIKGKFEVVLDDANETLRKAIAGES